MRRALGRSSLPLACLLAVLLAGQAWAREDRTPVGDISLTFVSHIQSGESDGSVDVTVNSGECYLDGVEVINDRDQWSGGDEPKVKVYLNAETDYYFEKVNRSMFTLTGADARYVSSSVRDDKTNLILTVRLGELEEGDLSVGGLEWDEDSAEARWDENSFAKYYQVKLYRVADRGNDDQIASSRNTSNTDYDFSGHITRRGDYYFMVRAVDYGGNKGDWAESENMYVSARDADDFADSHGGSGNWYWDDDYYYDGYYSGSRGPGSVANAQNHSGPGATGGASGGSWVKDDVGWWYRNSDQTYTKNNWQLINGVWYFFDGRGYMMTGWILWNGKWYYCDTVSGAMWVNSRTPDGFWVGGDGAWTGR